jgi:hypothetical protein
MKVFETETTDKVEPPRKGNPMRRGRSPILVAIAALGMGVFLPIAGAASAQPNTNNLSAPGVPHVLPCVGSPEVRPANYLMSCADANASWKKVAWTTWAGKSATGTGDLYQNDCTPNCAAGHFHSYAAKVVLSGVIQTKKYGLLFSRATFSYSLKDKHESETFELAT